MGIINHLYAQINAYERSLERLKNEREAAIKRFLMCLSFILMNMGGIHYG